MAGAKLIGHKQGFTIIHSRHEHCMPLLVGMVLDVATWHRSQLGSRSEAMHMLTFSAKQELNQQ